VKLKCIGPRRWRELAAGQYPSLEEVLDEVGRKARARGLTQEILDSLLKGA